MGLIPAGATYGSYSWTDKYDNTSDAGRVQTFKFKAVHTVHVYFANYDKPFSYYVIDHVSIAADPGTAYRQDDDGRGFFNSSAEVIYRNVTASDSCNVRQTVFAPAGDMANQFAFEFNGTEMVLDAAIGGGSGRVVFKPSQTMNANTNVQGWQIHPSGGDGWIVHQKDVWNSLGKDGQGSAKATAQMLDDLFEGTPFGNVAKMPDSSWYPLRCELVSMWNITKSSGEFKQDQRVVTLTLEMDYRQRLTAFVNAKVEPDRDALRKSVAVQPPAVPVKCELKLHDIAKDPSK
jgi:hypothetical protein